MRFTGFVIAAAFVAAAVPLLAQTQQPTGRHDRDMRVLRAFFQSGAATATETFNRTVPLSTDGQLSLQNIGGDIIVNPGSRREVVISAVKRTRGDRNELSRVHIEVDSSGGRVDVRTVYDTRARFDRERVWVDYTVTVPMSAAVELRSISGAIKVTGVHGMVRAESVSGNIVTSGTPALEMAKSVSGQVDVSDVAGDRGLSLSSVSGSLRGKNIKTRSVDFKTVSGDITITDGVIERMNGRTVSGQIEYAGAIAKAGAYDLNSHSGSIRLMLADNAGFHLSAGTFSGSIRSDFPLTIGGPRVEPGRGRRGRRINQSMDAISGDGSAHFELRSFSGDIVITKR